MDRVRVGLPTLHFATAARHSSVGVHALRSRIWAGSQDRRRRVRVRARCGEPRDASLRWLASCVELPVGCDRDRWHGSHAGRPPWRRAPFPSSLSASADPVGAGLVSSLGPARRERDRDRRRSHPDSDARKRLEARSRKLVPSAREVAFIYNPNNPSTPPRSEGSPGRCGPAPVAPPPTPYSRISQDLTPILQALRPPRESAILVAMSTRSSGTHVGNRSPSAIGRHGCRPSTRLASSLVPAV